MKLRDTNGLLSWAFPVCTFFIAVWILCLPVFPSSDGSVHLYYAHISGQLLHPPGDYGVFYVLRRFAGPYSLHYMFLAALEGVVGLNEAEKLFVVLIVLLVASGFCFLSAQSGRNRALSSLWAVPLLLSWTMLGGFLNYSFAVGILLWSLGCWVQLRKGFSLPAFAGYSLTLLLLVLSHPVPLLLLIAWTGLDLLIMLLQKRYAGQQLPKGFWGAGFTLVLSCMAFLVPMLIADHSRIKHEAASMGISLDVLHDFFSCSVLVMPDMVYGAGLAYRFVAMLIAPFAVLLILYGSRERWRKGEFQDVDRAGLVLLILLLGSLFLPDTLNGSHFFAQRMWWPLWLISLAVLCGKSLPEGMRCWIQPCGVLMAVATLAVVAFILTPVSRRIAEIDATNLPHGKRGLFLASHATQEGFGLSFCTYCWSGVRAFAHSDAILLNSPWMGITISPLRSRGNSDLFSDNPAFAERRVGTDDVIDIPANLTTLIKQDEQLRQEAYRHADFVYYIDPDSGQSAMVQSLRELGLLDANQWICNLAKNRAVCRKRAQ